MIWRRRKCLACGYRFTTFESKKKEKPQHVGVKPSNYHNPLDKTYKLVVQA